MQRREGIWVVVDLDSTNGTSVDGERVRGEVPLAPGAVIKFGDIEMLFEPTDDTAERQSGGGTRVISSAGMPDAPAPSGPRPEPQGRAAPPTGRPAAPRPSPPAAPPADEPSSGMTKWLIALGAVAVVALLLLLLTR